MVWRTLAGRASFAGGSDDRPRVPAWDSSPPSGLTLLWGWNVGDTLFDTSTWPVTHLVVGEVIVAAGSVHPSGW